MDDNIFKVLRNFAMSTVGETLLIATSVLILIGGIFYHFVEDWSWVDSFYFTVITLTTVGYGDISPQTTLGKLFTIGYILIGIGILIALVTEVGNQILAARPTKATDGKDDKAGNEDSG